MDFIKNAANKVLMTGATYLVAPPTQTQFLEKGLLTAQEFIAAGDKLIANCGSWRWYPAVDPAHQTKYLPADKQFLGIENVISKQRVRDLISGSGIEMQDGDDEAVIMSKQEVGEKQHIIEEDAEERQYNLYVVYDLYYFTPRLYIQGSEKGLPLKYAQVKEDIMIEYADKTVTEEFHPHLNIYLPTIHPCKHADTLKFLTQQMIENGADPQTIHADNSVLIFLKFMGSVIPTIQFDFVSEIQLG